MRNRSMAYLMQSDNILECDAELALTSLFPNVLGQRHHDDGPDMVVSWPTIWRRPRHGERLVEN